MISIDGGMRASGEPPYWQAGDVINWRYRKPARFGHPEAVTPSTVVRDDESGLVVWIAEGTPMWTVGRADGRKLREAELSERFHGDRVQTRGEWQGPGVLRIAPTGRPWSVWLFRDPSGSHRGWYVNLERPHLRDAHNVYTEDYILDLLVTLDRQTIRKDEDELAAALQAGRFAPEEVDHIREIADEAERAVRDWGYPYDAGWESWEPPDAWPVPALPAL